MGIPRTRGLLYSPWQPLGIPSAITPIGQLHQSRPPPRATRSTPEPIRTVEGNKSFFNFYVILILLIFFFVALHIFAKFSPIPSKQPTVVFCHLPDFPDSPVPTARKTKRWTKTCSDCKENKKVDKNFSEKLPLKKQENKSRENT